MSAIPRRVFARRTGSPSVGFPKVKQPTAGRDRYPRCQLVAADATPAGLWVTGPPSTSG
jgi:hypothetical protein